MAYPGLCGTPYATPLPPICLYVVLVFVLSFTDTSDEEEEEDYSVGVTATPRRRKEAKALALLLSKSSGRYPQFRGLREPAEVTNPHDHDALDFVKLVWPSAVCEMLAVEMNRYAAQNQPKGWFDTTASEIWVFLGVVILMGNMSFHDWLVTGVRTSSSVFQHLQSRFLEPDSQHCLGTCMSLTTREQIGVITCIESNPLSSICRELLQLDIILLRR